MAGARGDALVTSYAFDSSRVNDGTALVAPSSAPIGRYPDRGIDPSDRRPSFIERGGSFSRHVLGPQARLRAPGSDNNQFLANSLKWLYLVIWGTRRLELFLS